MADKEALTSFAEAFSALLIEHAECRWSQVGPCVYCDDHGVRLYQGDLPDEKRTTPVCADGRHDWDPDMGLGFYFLCCKCGFKEWAE